MRYSVLAVPAALLLVSATVAPADEKGDKRVPPVLNFKMKDITGKEVDLSRYQGKVLLIVNVASKCGCTPQYKALEQLHEKYGKDGLAIIGVPCNDFGGQEPGSEEEIVKFCKSKYDVKFDMMAKVTVKGDDTAPLYQYLTSKKTNPQFGGDIKWNFTKFLIGRNGEIVARYEPRTEPQTADVVKTIEGELKK
jgi:glutathione peroxidase